MKRSKWGGRGLCGDFVMIDSKSLLQNTPLGVLTAASGLFSPAENGIGDQEHNCRSCLDSRTILRNLRTTNTMHCEPCNCSGPEGSFVPVEKNGRTTNFRVFFLEYSGGIKMALSLRTQLSFCQPHQHACVFCVCVFVFPQNTRMEQVFCFKINTIKKSGYEWQVRIGIHANWSRCRQRLEMGEARYLSDRLSM